MQQKVDSVKSFTAQTKKDIFFKRAITIPNYKNICDIGMVSSELYSLIQILKSYKKKKFLTLAFTSNVISSGLRKCIIDLMPYCKCILTTTGAIEEDIIKTDYDFQMCEYYNDWSKLRNFFEKKPNCDKKFSLDGQNLRSNGMNRIGNILVHNNCYIAFERYLIYKLQGDKSVYLTKDIANILTPEKSILKDIGLTKKDIQKLNVDSNDNFILENENIDSNDKEILDIEKLNDGLKKNLILENENIHSNNKESLEEQIENNQILEKNGSETEINSSSFLQVAKSHKVPVYISSPGDGSLGDIYTFFLSFRINSVLDFKNFIEDSKDTLGLVLGDGVIQSRMRYLDRITITNKDRKDASDHENGDKMEMKIIGDLSLILPVLIKEVFLDF